MDGRSIRRHAPTTTLFPIGFAQPTRYQDTTGKVFASPEDHFPEVNLVRGPAIEDVDIHLGPPDGLVEGSVIDGDTGSVVRFAQITIRWADEPSVFSSENIPQAGQFGYALPKRPITIEITAPGYRPWTCSDATTKAHFILLEPNARATLNVGLEKEPPVTPR
jgi:hypothetical protein